MKNFTRKTLFLALGTIGLIALSGCNENQIACAQQYDSSITTDTDLSGYTSGATKEQKDAYKTCDISKLDDSDDTEIFGIVRGG